MKTTVCVYEASQTKRYKYNNTDLQGLLNCFRRCASHLFLLRFLPSFRPLFFTRLFVYFNHPNENIAHFWSAFGKLEPTIAQDGL